MTDNRLICINPSKDLTQFGRYAIILERGNKIKIQLDSGRYGWVSRRRFMTMRKFWESRG